MRRRLTIHPDFACPAVSAIEVDVTRLHTNLLTLTWRLAGDLQHLYLPPAATSARTDELWRRTCFEAFVSPRPGEAYFEFNLAPSTQWAAYSFTGYRRGMAPADLAAPVTRVTTNDAYFELQTSLEIPSGVPWRLALSAVIEDAAGARSYWALAHPPGKPDFHHAAGFVLDLPPPERP